MEREYQVLLYYHYTTIEEPEEFAADHLTFCKGLNLKGRILVAKEGINGTVSGLRADTEAYMEAMKKHPLFEGLIFKIDEEDQHAFKKMHVRPREELVTFRLNEEDVDPRERTGTYLTPKEWKEAMQREDTVVIDARNDYEYDVGHFRGAVRPDIETFRDLPDWIRSNKEQFQNKKILTYCTGGIRCEKFSGWLKQEGFEDVSQLHGGIVTYGKDPEVQGELWDGQCYVFDERLTVPINHVNSTVVGKDYFDDEPCERYMNCANPDCNKQILASEENEHKHMRGCTSECRVHPRNLYVKEHNLSPEQIEARLAVLGETMPVRS
ncbi:oxygen-dependent tRNA uridine(34) hydroxylase TrhO [Shouchella shacheensis]|uniref:oxygen-dependent tRNA uridine(34) hydroxylase TrhO n=1 Tax=Shouchella shacheensis TaxID=1649580 RepID=UPI00073FBDC6|nr:rhodanese-related sulfurtransferase [Shouchella shacheensis]